VDFEYTPEQIALRKAVREFAEGEIAPHVMEWDEAQTFPMDVVRKLGQLFASEAAVRIAGEIQRLVIARQLLKTR
jgi:alkylation response protein AidB-like acyl-CoA dehydrogenase